MCVAKGASKCVCEWKILGFSSMTRRKKCPRWTSCPRKTTLLLTVRLQSSRFSWITAGGPFAQCTLPSTRGSPFFASPLLKFWVFCPPWTLGLELQALGNITPENCVGQVRILRVRCPVRVERNGTNEVRKKLRYALAGASRSLELRWWL